MTRTRFGVAVSWDPARPGILQADIVELYWLSNASRRRLLSRRRRRVGR